MTPGQIAYKKEAEHMTGESWAELPEGVHILWENHALGKAEPSEELCFKCKGTRDMGFTMHVTCDAC